MPEPSWTDAGGHGASCLAWSVKVGLMPPERAALPCEAGPLMLSDVNHGEV